MDKAVYECPRCTGTIVKSESMGYYCWWCDEEFSFGQVVTRPSPEEAPDDHS